MDPWWAKGAVLAASGLLVAIRAPHGSRSAKVPVARSGRGPLEILLLTLAWISFFLPLLWVFTPLFAFANYALHPAAFWIGIVLIAMGLWLFHRSHADLGTNWSITLEVREGHRLVRHGVYQRVRHPMYLALLLYALGFALVLPNWFVGPSYLIAMSLLVALRLDPEERLMRETFGADYDDYAKAAKRLLPGVW